MTTKLAECAWEQGQIVKSAMSYDRGEKFLPSVVGNNYDWLRFKCYMGNVGSDLAGGLVGGMGMASYAEIGDRHP